MGFLNEKLSGPGGGGEMVIGQRDTCIIVEPVCLLKDSCYKISTAHLINTNMFSSFL